MPVNYAKTAILLAAMTALFLAVGYALGGEAGMILAFVFAMGMNAFSYWNSDKMVLRMYGAKQVDGSTAPDFVNTVQPARAQRWFAHAQGLCDRQSPAQRLCHRTQSGKRGSGGDDRSFAHAHAGGNRRCHGP